MSSETIDRMIGEFLAHKDTPSNADGVFLRFSKGVPISRFDLEGKHDETAETKQVDYDSAADLLKRYFYSQPMIYTLPTSVQPMMFDEAMNFGAIHAIECLQNAILVPSSGRLDDMTRSVLNDTVLRVGLAAVVGHIVDHFEIRYRKAAWRNVRHTEFLDNWIARSESWRAA